MSDDDPWEELRLDPSITVHFVRLPAGLLGFCDHATRQIWIATGLRQRQRRKVLRHELTHLKRGPVFAHWVEEEERAVEDVTARALISIASLCEALRWTRDLHEIAVELHVPVELIPVRMSGMKHPAERAAVQRVLDDVASMHSP